MDYRAADLKLRNAKPKATNYEIALGGGLSARIAADGSAKTIYWRGKHDGRVIRVKMGNYPATTVRDAAEKARETHAAVKNGVDPNLKARRERQGNDVPVTVRDAVERFDAEHLKVKAGDRWGAEAARMLERDILPTIGSNKLTDVTRVDLVSLVDRKAAELRKAAATRKNGSGVAANRLVAVLGKFFAVCVDKGWLAASPAIRLPKPVRETKRERVLTAVELGETWNALQDAQTDESMPGVYARVLSLLALTGCRCSEITSLRRDAVDLEASTLTVVKGKTAASRRALPLSAAARVLLVEACGGASDTDALLFTKSRATKQIPSEDISKACRGLVKRLGHKGWTPHDLRRTVTTELHELGVDYGVVKRITGHVGADVHASVYDRSRQTEKMRAAMELLERQVLACAAKVEKPKENNVVALRAG
jgi:integrase